MHSFDTQSRNVEDCLSVKIEPFENYWRHLLFISVSRTKVIDDEMDYFSVDSNRWLSQTEREKLRSKEEELRKLKHASRRNQSITLDFAGRRVMDDRNRVGQSMQAAVTHTHTHTHTLWSVILPGFSNKLTGVNFGHYQFFECFIDLWIPSQHYLEYSHWKSTRKGGMILLKATCIENADYGIVV